MSLKNEIVKIIEKKRRCGLYLDWNKALHAAQLDILLRKLRQGGNTLYCMKTCNQLLITLKTTVPIRCISDYAAHVMYSNDTEVFFSGNYDFVLQEQADIYLPKAPTCLVKNKSKQENNQHIAKNKKTRIVLAHSGCFIRRPEQCPRSFLLLQVTKSLR